ncbi:phage capsid scaffolding protein (GPO) [gamma proteobacterium HTCC5015]|nr:phage capsid scaffolding protein (GPO) [gamma proteobacterium HTCC5015]
MLKKKFRIAREGATTDGRTITREWIEQMAANYNPETYGARINIEHLRGLFPDGPLPMLGDVLSLTTEEHDGKLALVAELAPTEELIAYSRKRQKVYTSIEVDPEFADTGEAYLVGLAVTDSPASLGTEMLQFSAEQKQNPLATRKQSPSNLFTAAMEVEMDFSDEPEKPNKLSAMVKQLFKRTEKNSTDMESFTKDLESAMTQIVEKIGEYHEASATAEEFNKLKSEHEALKEEFKALTEKLSSQPQHRSKQFGRADGNGGVEQTDC